MKKIIAAAAALLLLICMVTASAGTAGSSSDPLISLSYLNDIFSAELKSAGGEVSGKNLKEAYDKALLKLDELYKNHVGYRLAPRYTEIGLASGKTVSLTTGSSFVLLTGSATLTISGGSVVNVSTGYEVSSGSLVTINQRYFCTENTTAIITASSESTGFIDGYFMTDGVIDPNATVFNDVRRSDWFHPAVDYVYNNGLFAGTSATTFSPGMPMTRAMFATVLYRLDGEPGTIAESLFSDVGSKNEYFYIPVSWASENNIASGYEDGTFKPDSSITREQMALFMYRYAAFKGYDMSASGTVYDSFPDRSDVSPYATEALRWAVSKGIINGSDGLLMPSNTATRAQVAQIIYNFTLKIP